MFGTRWNAEEIKKKGDALRILEDLIKWTNNNLAQMRTFQQGMTIQYKKFDKLEKAVDGSMPYQESKRYQFSRQRKQLDSSFRHFFDNSKYL